MTSKDIEKVLLKEIKEFYDDEIQALLYRDMNKINGTLKVPRVMTRTVSSEKLRSYEEQEVKENDIVARQVDVIKYSIYINFIGIEQEKVSRIRNYFNHKRGFSWFVQQADINLVRMSTSEIRDITDHEAKGMLECWQFDMSVRTDEVTDVKIPYVKEIDFKAKEKTKED